MEKLPDPFSILRYKLKQSLQARNSFKSKIFWKMIIKKPEKVNFIFSFEPVPFSKQSFQKQKRSGTSDQSLFRLQNEFRKIPLFVIYYLTKFDYGM